MKNKIDNLNMTQYDIEDLEVMLQIYSDRTLYGLVGKV